MSTADIVYMSRLPSYMFIESLRRDILVCNQPRHPFVGRRNEYQPLVVVTPCGWAVKSGMVCVGVIPLLHTGHIWAL